jgi:hypothetical protein
MLRALKVPTLALALMLTACGGSWHQVPVNVNPASVADPDKEIRTLLNMVDFPPVFVEVTDQYIKAIWPGGMRILMFDKVAEMRLINRDDIFQVSAYDAKGDEFFAYRPSTHDFATCERFLNAFYALSKKPPPGAPAGAPAAAAAPAAGQSATQ